MGQGAATVYNTPHSTTTTTTQPSIVEHKAPSPLGCLAVVSRDMIERGCSGLVGQQEWDRCPCECVSAQRSVEHPQILHIVRGMRRDTGTSVCVCVCVCLCACIQTAIVGSHPPDNSLVTSAVMFMPHTPAEWGGFVFGSWGHSAID